MKSREEFPIVIPSKREYVTVVGAIGVPVPGTTQFKHILHNKTDTQGFLRLLKELRSGVPDH